jgi:hypothetical protein
MNTSKEREISCCIERILPELVKSGDIYQQYSTGFPVHLIVSETKPVSGLFSCRKDEFPAGVSGLICQVAILPDRPRRA